MSAPMQVEPGDVIAALRKQLSEAHFELAMSNAARAQMARTHEAEIAKVLEAKTEKKKSTEKDGL